MTEEYSYFRVEGQSLAAIRRAAEAKDEVKAREEALCKRFGAGSLAARYDAETGRYRVSHFRFEPGAKMPEGWQAKEQTLDMGNGEKKVVAVYALPAFGSADAFYLANMEGLLDRPARLSKLENIFGTGDLPERQRPKPAEDDNYSTAFVRGQTVKQNPSDTRDLDEGWRKDNVTFSFGIMWGADSLDSMAYNGETFLRVPNNPEGQPYFTPPDSARVPLAEMLEIDQKAHEKMLPSPAPISLSAPGLMSLP